MVAAVPITMQVPNERAMPGNAQFQHEWDGAIYWFASAKHLELFKADPDRYLPQYNNWCAASVSRGEKVHGNPEWWLITDRRLYLFGRPIGPGLMKSDPSMAFLLQPFIHEVVASFICDVEFTCRVEHHDVVLLQVLDGEISGGVLSAIDIEEPGLLPQLLHRHF